MNKNVNFIKGIPAVGTYTAFCVNNPFDCADMFGEKAPRLTCPD